MKLHILIFVFVTCICVWGEGISGGDAVEGCPGADGEGENDGGCMSAVNPICIRIKGTSFASFFSHGDTSKGFFDEQGDSWCVSQWDVASLLAGGGSASALYFCPLIKKKSSSLMSVCGSTQEGISRPSEFNGIDVNQLRSCLDCSSYEQTHARRQAALNLAAKKSSEDGQLERDEMKIRNEENDRERGIEGNGGRRARSVPIPGLNEHRKRAQLNAGTSRGGVLSPGGEREREREREISDIKTTSLKRGGENKAHGNTNHEIPKRKPIQIRGGRARPPPPSSFQTGAMREKREGGKGWVGRIRSFLHV